MKFTNESLDELVVTTVGENVLPLVHILQKKDNISEFKLAEMLNVTVNQIRNMLYKLNEQNLVSFIRKKDKKKGWYIYYWSINRKSIEGSILKVKLKQLDDLKSRLGREEEGLFYVCPMGCCRQQMEVAMEHEFRCQECGTLLKEQDNSKTISNIKKMIADLEEEIRKLQEEPVKKVKQLKKKKEVRKPSKKTFKKPVKKLIKKIVKKISKKQKKKI
jgi:transcription initiation factor TFIIE subunit alpha